MINLMFNKADVYRPNFTTGTAAQAIGSYSLVYSNVVCNVQPMDSKEAVFYLERGLENSTTIYTTRTDLTFKKNDLFEVNGDQYHVEGIKNGVNRNIYFELICFQYPNDAKKRLDREQY